MVFWDMYHPDGRESPPPEPTDSARMAVVEKTRAEQKRKVEVDQAAAGAKRKKMVEESDYRSRAETMFAKLQAEVKREIVDDGVPEIHMGVRTFPGRMEGIAQRFQELADMGRLANMGKVDVWSWDYEP